MSEPVLTSDDPFEGMTRTACADACRADGCIVSARSYCAHPCKGGLHVAEMSNPEAQKRRSQAKLYLERRAAGQIVI